MDRYEEIKIWCVGGEDVRFRLPFLKKLRGLGFQVGAVGSERGDAFAGESIEYHRYPLARDLRPWTDLKSLRALMRLFSTHQVDIVHAFDTKPGMLVPIAAGLAGSTTVCKTVTGMGQIFSSTNLLTSTLKPVYCIAQALASRICGMTVFQNTDDFAYFKTLHLAEPGRMGFVPSSGIDLTEFPGPEPTAGKLSSLREELGIRNGYTFILIARLVRDKGIAEYLEACRRIRRKYPDTTCLLVGPRESEGSQAIPDELLRRYSADTLYLGRRNDVRELLAISDALVLPTYYREGVPRVLLEAGAASLPCITTGMPGCRDAVIDGWNGLLVPPRDAAALAGAMERLLSDREMGELMGRKARAHVEEHFDLDLITRAYARIYLDLVRRKSASGKPVPDVHGVSGPQLLSVG